MKKSLIKAVSIFVMVGVLGVAGWQLVQPEVTNATSWSYENADYRGTFSDRGIDQVSVQFTLEDNIITDMSYRHLAHSDIDYRQLDEEHALYPIVEQHDQVIDYLVGNDVRTSLDALYEPGTVVEDIDSFSGATLRGGKIISAVRDALNRGPYRY
ncbi:hypothetical protein MWH25_02785 [Natroniella acetigena]|uniref:hypothetical protein n=1 Tax=Natroniella acetigena TaxID=52004 RepID=UPI00200B3EFC|nr:hypothetical protein [Natroniella acetigena]MCK8826676.1 hypothetical protein [Natroniella acetigena]